MQRLYVWKKKTSAIANIHACRDVACNVSTYGRKKRLPSPTFMPVETLHATSLRMDEKIPSIVTIVHCAVETLHATSLRMDEKIRSIVTIIHCAVETLHATSLRMDEKNVCHRQHSGL
ncbi:MAG: hypothetical protein U0264_03690 [Candidatus Kapaibacterium sp.]